MRKLVYFLVLVTVAIVVAIAVGQNLRPAVAVGVAASVIVTMAGVLAVVIWTAPREIWPQQQAKYQWSPRSNLLITIEKLDVKSLAPPEE